MKACGRMWQRDGGVDLACIVDNLPHRLRLRFGLDADRTVRLWATGTAGYELIRAEITPRGIKVAPKRFHRFVEGCLRNAAAMLLQEARNYVASFPPQCRVLLNLKPMNEALNYIAGKRAAKPRGARGRQTTG